LEINYIYKLVSGGFLYLIKIGDAFNHNVPDTVNVNWLVVASGS